MNVDRPSDQLVYPFVTKQSTLTGFKTVSAESFHADFQYGDVIQGTYPLSSSISTNYYASAATRANVSALKNTLDYYGKVHPSFGNTNIFTDELKLVSIPSIMFGSKIQKGTVKLKLYLSGALAGELRDERKDGVLYQTGPYGSLNSGSEAGIVLYNEGFILLTGSWDISNGTHTEDYIGAGAEAPTWTHFAEKNVNIPSSSFEFEFNGTNKVPTLTMFAHAEKGELNHSNNPTYLKFGQVRTPSTGTHHYIERDDMEIKNTVKTPYANPTGSFEKQTWISKINIYDERKNLIAVAKFANLVKKKSNRDYTFKLKLDI
jgi:hypothetical protein